MRIQHAHFGFGLINDISGEGDQRIATIDFDNNQTKKILMKFAKLRIIE